MSFYIHRGCTEELGHWASSQRHCAAATLPRFSDGDVADEASQWQCYSAIAHWTHRNLTGAVFLAVSFLELAFQLELLYGNCRFPANALLGVLEFKELQSLASGLHHFDRVDRLRRVNPASSTSIRPNNGREHAEPMQGG